MFPIDRQDWKGLPVPRCCPFLHRIRPCLGIGPKRPKMRFQRVQRHHRSPQVSGFHSVVVRQRVWSGRGSCVVVCNWQLWIPRHGAAPGLLHKHETAHGQAPETNPLACSSTADQKEAPCPTRHLSRAAEVHQRTLVTTVKDVKEFLVHPDLVLLLPVGSVVFQLRKAKQLYCVWKKSLCFLVLMVLMDCISKLVVLLCFQRGDWLACFFARRNISTKMSVLSRNT